MKILIVNDDSISAPGIASDYPVTIRVDLQ